MMRNRLGAVLFAVGLAVAATAPASALTLPVIGGPGLDQGFVCTSGQCPGTPLLTLSGPAAVTGSITYHEGTSTVDITLTLTQDADFGGVAQLLAGTTIVATDVPVMTFPIGGGAFQIVQLGSAQGLVDPLLVDAPGGLTVLSNTPSVSGLTCSVGTGSDQCGVSFGPGGLEFHSGLLGQDLEAFVTFNVNVPEPGTLVTLAIGVAGLAFMGGRRRA